MSGAVARRLPSLGQIAALSPELDQLLAERPMRYNRAKRRFECITRLSQLCIPYSEIVTCSGASVTCTDLIPAGTALLGGITAWNQTAVTGATGYDLGIPGALDLFGRNLPVTLDHESDITDFWAANMVYYPEVTSVVLTAVGGEFTGGRVKVTAWGLPH